MLHRNQIQRKKNVNFNYILMQIFVEFLFKINAKIWGKNHTDIQSD